jgi:uncharacterized protein YdeI (YjbR/CyaY-like superfamily)
MSGASFAGELLHVADRRAWRRWLEAHHRTKREIWLVSYRKATGRPNLSYNDAVEEALCFGWIDSTRRGVDEERVAQRFSPRRPKSSYSQINKERLRVLVGKGQVIPEVVATLPDLDPGHFEVAPDIRRAVRADREAWANFRRLPGRYVRIRVAYIESARNRPEEFRKRLDHFVRMTAADRRFGYGGIEGYFEDE